MAAAILPDADEGLLAAGVLGQFHGVIGVFHRMMIDFFDHHPGFEAGFSGGRGGLNLGYDRAEAARYPFVAELTGSPPRDRPPLAGESELGQTAATELWMPRRRAAK